MEILSITIYKPPMINPSEKYEVNSIWLVVWTPLKNISQLGWLFPIMEKKMFQTTNQ